MKPFFDVVLDKVGLMRKGAVGPLPGDKIIYKSLREILGAKGSVVTKPYSESIWVYSAVNAIATNVARVPFRIKKDIGAGLSRSLEEGAIYDLFQNPNPLMSQRQLFEATMIFLSIYGECMWVLEGRENITQVPSEIWTFSPTRFTPVQNANGQVTGWYYDAGREEKIPLANHEVIFFKYFNPYDDIRGMSPLDAAKESINQDHYAAQYNSEFFKSGAKIGGFISIDGELTDEQFNRILKQFEDRHQGYSRAHKVALLEGGGKFTEAKMTQKDMDFVEGRKLTKQEILAAFKVNEVVLGVFDAVKSYDGAKAADKAFWEECLLPKTNYIEDHLWAKFFSHIGQRKGKGKVWGEFDLATVGSLQVNFADKIETAHKMFTMGWPINEINRRLELGMEDVKWGDQWWVPGGYLPVMQILEGKKEDPSDTNPDDDADDKPDDEANQDSIRSFLSLASPPEDPIETITLGETEFRTKVKKFVFEIRKKTLTSIYADEFVRPVVKKDFDKLTSDLQRVYFGIIASSFSDSALYLKKAQTVDGNNPDVVAYISGRIEVIVERFADLLESLFGALERTSEGNDVKADKARLVFNTLTQKSMQIARNESQYTLAFGRKMYLQWTLGDSLEYIEPPREEN